MLRSNSKSWFFCKLSDLMKKGIFVINLMEDEEHSGTKSVNNKYGHTSCWSPPEWNGLWQDQQGKLG